MDECTATTSNHHLLLWGRIQCIVSYSGSVGHSVLNYSLLIVSLVGYSLWFRNETTATRMSRSSTTTAYYETIPQPSSSSATTSTSTTIVHVPTIRSSLLSLGFTTAFQIGLCLGVHCSGISIIWCAVAGWMIGCCLVRQKINNSKHTFFLTIPLLLDAMGIVFYAFTAEGITTVAHVCAIALGIIMYWISTSTTRRIHNGNDQPPPTSSSLCKRHN